MEFLYESLDQDSGITDAEIIDLFKFHNLMKSEFNTLQVAVYNGRFECVQFIVDKYPDLLNRECILAQKNETIGHVALKKGYLEILEFLINKRRNLLELVLKSARQCVFSPEIVSRLEFLKRNDQILDQLNENNLLKKHITRLYCQELLCQLGTTSFDPVIQFEYIESEFISSFANANGTTFLHDSSLYGYYEIVNWLLSNTSVQLTYDYSGYTAVFYAVETNNLKILKLLLKYFPFGVEQRDEFGDGITLREYAFQLFEEGKVHKEIVDFLSNTKCSVHPIQDKVLKEWFYLFTTFTSPKWHKSRCFSLIGEKQVISCFSLREVEWFSNNGHLCEHCFNVVEEIPENNHSNILSLSNRFASFKASEIEAPTRFLFESKKER